MPTSRLSPIHRSRRPIGSQGNVVCRRNVLTAEAEERVPTEAIRCATVNRWESLLVPDLLRSTPIAPTRLTHPSARRSARRPMASPACASRSLAAPPSQESDDLAPPSAARDACEAIGDYRVRGSLHAALQDASTWLAQQSRMKGSVTSQQHPTG